MVGNPTALLLVDQGTQVPDLRRVWIGWLPGVSAEQVLTLRRIKPHPRFPSTASSCPRPISVAAPGPLPELGIASNPVLHIALPAAMGLLTWLGFRRKNQWERLTLLDNLLLSPLTFLVVHFYQLVLFLRGHPFRPPRDKPAIRVVCISDTHDRTVDIPSGDILIHAGDLTNSGTAADIQKQLDWLKRQPHQVKIVVAGNHDSYFDPSSRLQKDVQSGAKLDLSGIVYLESALTVQEVKGRKLSIFGVPDIPECGPKEFAPSLPCAIQLTLRQKFHRDLGLGDPHLLREVWRVKPRLHVFGHIHWGHGKESVYFDDLQSAYERYLSRPRRGLIRDFIPNAAWIDILEIVSQGVQSVLWKWIMGGPGSNHGSLMVNASQMYGNTGKAKSRAVIVDL
ncbi:putative rhamnogalacturonate lyase C [Paramyrothecium foliicola]|nr:putative rhamnogalacturonate lyase C [Paramyrothecium foliicola]